MVLALVGLTGSPAEATVPPKDVGWLDLDGGVGTAYFDADLAGSPSWEQIIVCDTKSNGRGVVVTVYGDESEAVVVRDPSNNGSCTTMSGNLFPDGYGVDLYVSEYAGNIYYPGQKHGRGVA